MWITFPQKWCTKAKAAFIRCKNPWDRNMISTLKKTFFTFLLIANTINKQTNMIILQEPFYRLVNEEHNNLSKVEHTGLLAHGPMLCSDDQLFTDRSLRWHNGKVSIHTQLVKPHKHQSFIQSWSVMEKSGRLSLSCSVSFRYFLHISVWQNKNCMTG